MADPVASEKAAELAKEAKLDLESVKGTGSNGNIKVDDVKQAIAARDAAETATAAPAKKAAAKEPASTDDAEAPAKRTGPTMPERSHKEGCPADADRVEIYEQTVPPKRMSDGAIETPARVATMAHCVDCGNTVELK